MGSSMWMVVVLFAGCLQLSSCFRLTSTTDNVTENYSYVIVMDGGSSHTNSYVYEWPTVKEHGTGLIRQKNGTRCNAVLSNFRENPSGAGISLKTCLDVAQDNIPQSQWSSTKVLLGATAGLRLIELEDKAASAAIIQSVRDYVRVNTTFVMEPGNIDVLSSEKEAGYAWTSINYIQEVFQTNALLPASRRNATWGSLEVGGASAQFAMEVPSSEIPSKFSIRSFNHDYQLLTWSFLCYGQNEAHRRYRGLLIASQSFRNLTYDACMPIGTDPIAIKHTDLFDQTCSRLNVPASQKKTVYYITGGGDEPQCRRETKRLFQMYPNQTATVCPFQDPDCSFQSTKEQFAKVPSGRFLAKGGFYFAAADLRTITNNSFELSPFDADGYDRARLTVCAKSFDELKDLLLIHTAMRIDFLLRLCFMATYNEILLDEVYGFKEEQLREMVIANDVQGQDVGWAFGWGLVASTDPAPSSTGSPMTNGSTAPSIVSTTTSGSDVTSPRWHTILVAVLLLAVGTSSAY
ncbi:putative Ectonucleoside triphosphate diphosphohydrolase 1 [Hypsibius exemplaris]|uniref:Ectonucleoside triphosphate diphosphohydrolase 1 n=1 Tax=Hypsibius exemplaris TaxID=2072580 RepID=A0A1W0X3X5_HYPEX|nr:putative Ectonucleoside triphosphate diphosphohydrolase 1 [Hypsibius exemplaris]